MAKAALHPPGIDWDPRGTRGKGTPATDRERAVPHDRREGRDDGVAVGHLAVRNGVTCAGSHLIIDVYGGERLDDLVHVEETLVDCVEAAGATLLHIHLHRFEENGGISGVAVLAESHISIHSWPEHGYAALDVFMCGDARPERCVDVVRRAFAPSRIAVGEILRGKAL